MDGMEVEVGGDDVRIDVVRRVLDRAEILGLVIVRYDDHAARMLPGRSFDAGTADRQAVDFGVVQDQSALLGVFFDITERGLVGHGGDGTGLEHVVAAEERFGVFMGPELIFACEIQVDIGALSPSNPRKVSNGISCPSRKRGSPQTGQVLSGRSNPDPTDPSVKNSNNGTFCRDNEAPGD